MRRARSSAGRFLIHVLGVAPESWNSQNTIKCFVSSAITKRTLVLFNKIDKSTIMRLAGCGSTFRMLTLFSRTDR